MREPPSLTKKIYLKSEVNVNSKINLEVRNHSIYYLCKVSRSSVDSLVDRGYNGSLVGNNVIVIAKHHDRTVYVRRIENHEITSIPLVTKGGVVVTTSDEVVMMMHQHVSTCMTYEEQEHPLITSNWTPQK